MMTPVPVAVHRWFERGEGWAHDPLCTAALKPEAPARGPLAGASGFNAAIEARSASEGVPSLALRASTAAALNVLFDRQLKHPEMGSFLVRTPEGVWVGSLEPDGQALDPHVRPGETPILRAALLPYAPDGEVQETVLRELARLTPQRPGEDAGLALQVSFDGIPEPPRANGGAHPRRPIRLPVSLLAVSVLLLGMLAVALTRPGTVFRNGPPGPEPSHVEKMASLLRQWGEAVPDENPNLVVRRFFGLLARPTWTANLDANAHPYHAFVLRLPAKPVAVNDTEEATVRAALAALLAHLRKGPTPDTFDGLLEALDEALTYENWWQQDGRWRRYTRLEARPGRTVRAFVARFRRPEVELTATAEQMLLLLEKWRVTGFTRLEAQQHPDLVCAAFFRLLCKKDFSYRQLRPNHPDTVFVSRLPEEPLDGGRPLMTAAELHSALNRLARHLDPKFPASDPARCLERIGREMDHKTWLATAGKGQRLYRDEEQKIDERVAEFAARFK